DVVARAEDLEPAPRRLGEDGAGGRRHCHRVPGPEAGRLDRRGPGGLLAHQAHQGRPGGVFFFPRRLRAPGVASCVASGPSGASPSDGSSPGPAASIAPLSTASIGAGTASQATLMPGGDLAPASCSTTPVTRAGLSPSGPPPNPSAIGVPTG